MKIYLDYIFLENLIVNAVIIFETVLYTRKVNIKLGKKIFIVIFCSILSVVLYINSVTWNYFFQFILSNIVCIMLFGFESIIVHIKNILTYYFVYIVYIGSVVITTLILDINLDNILNKLLIYIIIWGFAHLFNKHLWKMWKTNVIADELVYRIKINNTIFPVFLDTGNMAKDFTTNLYVIFLNLDLENVILSSNTKKEIKFSVLTVNGIELKTGYIVRNIKLYKQNEEIGTIPKVIICFSNITNTPEKYSGIIGYELYLDCVNGGV